MDEQFAYTVSPEPENAPPASPFADSPYVMATPVQEPPKPAKKKNGAWKGILAVILAIALVAVSGGVTALLVNRAWQEKLELLNQSVDNKLSVMQSQIDAISSTGGGTVVNTGDALTPGQVYAQNVRAVVAVSCYIQDYSGAYESFGSGFIISEDGYVVSNAHVVEGATSITVTTADGEEYPAELIGSDDTNDVSLLKIEGTQFPRVQIGSSDSLAVGDQVMAIGNPLGELTSTLTVGYVSAKDRVVATDGTSLNMLQTDAAINSGNSGGPLFNAYGEVVGITTAKYSGTSESGASIEGIGFAIPMDDAMGIVEDLQEYGYVKTAYLGAYVREVTEEAQSFGHPAGVYVEEVMPGLAAEGAGIQPGDTIVELGGYTVSSMAELTRALRKLEAGQTTTITVYRKGAEVILSITLSEKPQEEETVTEEPAYVPGDMDDWYREFFGEFFG